MDGRQNIKKCAAGALCRKGTGDGVGDVGDVGDAHLGGGYIHLDNSSCDCGVTSSDDGSMSRHNSSRGTARAGDDQKEAILTADDLRCIKEHNALVDLALIQPDEEEIWERSSVQAPVYPVRPILRPVLDDFDASDAAYSGGLRADAASSGAAFSGKGRSEATGQSAGAGAHTHTHTYNYNYNYPAPPEDYVRELIGEASSLQGSVVSTYQEAVAVVAAAACKNNLINVDIIDASECFDKVIERHTTVDAAAIAAALTFNENLVVIDDHGGGLEAVIRTAQQEDMEYHVVKAPAKTVSSETVDSSLAALMLQLSRLPGRSGRGRVVVITDLKLAADAFRSELISATVTRKIGGCPVPPGVHIAIVESGDFDLGDLPPELIVQSICVTVKARDLSAVDEVMHATEARVALIERQIRAAEEAGDTLKAAKLHEIRRKSGYVGAWRPGPGGDSQGGGRGGEAGNLADVSVDAALESLVTSGGGYSRHDKASLITDITVPERSDLRRAVAQKLLTGVYGREFAANALANYLRQNLGPLAGKPTVEDVASGTCSVDDVRRALATGDIAYASSLAVELRTSPFVDGVMTRGGDGAEKLRSIFSALMDIDPRTSVGIVKDRPYFFKS